MLCAKCQKNEATIHLTTVVGTDQETIDFCKDCAPPGIADLDFDKAKTLCTIGKKCEFCGAAAYSGQMLDGGEAIYWCFNCGTELMSITAEWLNTERPDLLQRCNEAVSFLSLSNDSDFLAWSSAANRKAVQLLKERRRQDGRDQNS
jgi:hypothetical protein